LLSQIIEIPKDIKSKYHPPDFPVRAMAEWEEIEGCMMAWVGSNPDFTTEFLDELSKIIEIIQKEVKVYLLCDSPMLAHRDLTKRNISTANIQFIEAENLKTPWCRDYGPLSVYSQTDPDLQFIDWIYNQPYEYDDKAPTYLAFMMGVPLFKTIIPPYTLVFSGANLMVDGHNTGFINQFYKEFQIEKSEEEFDLIFKRFFGIDFPIKVNFSYEHLDSYFKLIDEETILVQDFPSSNIGNKNVSINNLLFILNNYKSCYGRPYRVVRLPYPEFKSSKDIPRLTKDDYPTYVNSLILNKTVLVPIYKSLTDSLALKIYQNVMPGYKVIGVNCSSLIRWRGTIHCITKELGVREPIFISHAPLSVQSLNSEGFDIKSYIDNKHGISEAKVYWKTKVMDTFIPIPMEGFAENWFYATIPPQEEGTEILYYIQATNNQGKSINKPMVAPEGAWNFKINSKSKTINIKPVAKWGFLNVPEIPLISRSKISKTENKSVLVNSKMRASHILVYSEKEVAKIISALQNGDDFGQLASLYSKDKSTAIKGGDIGNFKKGDLLPEFERIISSLKIGEMNKIPLRTILGYHIFKRTG
jgi:agmatine/peptidylarginine deiminase